LRWDAFAGICRDQIAGVAQLVEHNVANVVVVGSIPITRSAFLVAQAFWVSGTK
jgi:hypothetical protein